MQSKLGGITQMNGLFYPSSWEWIIPVGGILAALGILVLRFLESRRAVSQRSLLIPPLGMSTGFLMFLYPPTQIPWLWALLALLCGCLLLSPLLIATSQLQKPDEHDVIRMKPSPLFAIILVLIIMARLVFRRWLEQHLEWPQTAGIAFLLAFGMLLPWRLALYSHYRKLRNQYRTT